MTATVNGEPRTLSDDATVAELVAALELPAAGIAIAVNQSVVRRGAFATHRLAEGDAVEIIRAVAGG